MGPGHPRSLLLGEGFSWGLPGAILSSAFDHLLSEWALMGFSPLWHIRALEEPPRGLWKLGSPVLGCVSRLGSQHGSHPVAAAQIMGWGTPGAALAKMSPLFCVLPLPC